MRDDVSAHARRVKPAKKQTRVCSATEQVSQPHVTCLQQCGSRLRGSHLDVFVQPPIRPHPLRWMVIARECEHLSSLAGDRRELLDNQVPGIQVPAAEIYILHEHTSR